MSDDIRHESGLELPVEQARDEQPERRAEPAQPGREAVYGPCIGCGARCDVSEFVACPECLADRDKTMVAAARYDTLKYWFRKFGSPTQH